jgi:type II secretory pathway pseudopilin PulG
MHKYKFKEKESGVTLIELLVIVVVIGILSTFTLSVINTRSYRERANDAVKATNVRKTAEALEAYRMAEGSYPEDTDSDGDLYDNNPLLINYLRIWPNNNPPGTTYTYYVSGTTIGITVPAMFNNVFKYRNTSTWKALNTPVGSVKLCATASADDDTCPTANTH